MIWVDCAWAWITDHATVLAAVVGALAAVAVARFTYTLKKSTDKLWEAGERQIAAAKESADAAKKAAETLPRVERAHVFLWYELRRKVKQSLHQGTTVEIEFALKNYGKTPALLKDIFAKLEIFDAYPNDFGPISDRRGYPPGLTIGGGELAPYLPCRRVFTDQEWEKVQAGNVLLLFVGIVKYEDVFGEYHETGFCSEWNPKSPGFEPSPTAKLNYYT